MRAREGGEARRGEARRRTEGQRREERRGARNEGHTTPTAHVTRMRPSQLPVSCSACVPLAAVRCCRCCWIPARTHRARHAAERTNQIPAHTAHGRARTHTSPPPSPSRFAPSSFACVFCAAAGSLRASWPLLCFASLCLCPLLSAPLAKRRPPARRPTHQRATATNTQQRTTRTNAHIAATSNKQPAGRATPESSNTQARQRAQQMKGVSEARLKALVGSDIAHSYEQLL
jgi:hypothetical protein